VTDAGKLTGTLPA